MIDPPARRRPKGRFGGLWQFRGFRGVGTRDWAARVSLRGERGCASEPVAREGACCAELRRYQLTFLMFGLFEYFGLIWRIIFRGPFGSLCILRQHPPQLRKI